MITPAQREIIQRHTSSLPVRVGQLARDLGLKVSLANLSPNISGLIEPAGDDESFHIRVNRYETEERQRFTVAHEISHFLLHRDFIRNGIIDNVMYRSSLSSAKETEANRLAADIIMPNDLVLRELAAMGGKRDDVAAEALARKFKVSRPAMKVRLGIA